MGRDAQENYGSAPAFSEGSKGASLEYIVFQEFQGMSTQAMRQALDEKKLAWCENLQPIGSNNLKTVGSALPSLTLIVGETITKEYYCSINNINYLVCFCVSGAAYGVNLANGAQTKFANAGTFSLFPDCTVWQNIVVVINDPQAGYCGWNGTAFTQKGGVSFNIPVTNGGSGYTGGATVAVSGGSGSGWTGTATVVAGVVTAIVTTNPGTGYLAGDTLTVTITAVAGGTGATALAHVWPFILPNGTSIAVFQGRVFLSGGRVLTYSGTGATATYGGQGYDDFLPADASGSFTITDSDLVSQITCIRSLNNYLYIIGDTSVKQIGNLTVSGTTTSFTLVTLSSDQGTIFPNTVISYNRLLLFANTVGVYAVFGSSVEKISDDMDGIFENVNFTQLPCAAVNDINNIHCYLLLVRYNDPVAGTRSLILAYQNKKWFVISQGNNITFIATAIVGGITETFCTSGADVTQIIQSQSIPQNILVKTSLTAHGNPVQRKRTTRYAVAQFVSDNNNLTLLVESESNSKSIGYTAAVTTNFINNSGAAVQFQNNSAQNVNFFGPGFVNQTGQASGAAGIYLGATLSGTVSNFALNSIILEYELTSLFGTTGV